MASTALQRMWPGAAGESSAGCSTLAEANSTGQKEQGAWGLREKALRNQEFWAIWMHKPPLSKLR